MELVPVRVQRADAVAVACVNSPGEAAASDCPLVAAPHRSVGVVSRLLAGYSVTTVVGPTRTHQEARLIPSAANLYFIEHLPLGSAHEGQRDSAELVAAAARRHKVTGSSLWVWNIHQPWSGWIKAGGGVPNSNPASVRADSWHPDSSMDHIRTGRNRTRTDPLKSTVQASASTAACPRRRSRFRRAASPPRRAPPSYAEGAGHLGGWSGGSDPRDRLTSSLRLGPTCAPLSCVRMASKAPFQRFCIRACSSGKNLIVSIL